MDPGLLFIRGTKLGTGPASYPKNACLQGKLATQDLFSKGLDYPFRIKIKIALLYTASIQDVLIHGNYIDTIILCLHNSLINVK